MLTPGRVDRRVVSVPLDPKGIVSRLVGFSDSGPIGPLLFARIPLLKASSLGPHNSDPF